MRVTVFGLGEAGSLIAADLAAAGAEVHSYDPADIATPEGVTRHDEPGTSVKDSRLVLAITAAMDAQRAIAQVWSDMRRGTIYADLSTAPPGFKEDLADTAALRGLPFADVALMGAVPGKGRATPANRVAAGLPLGGSRSPSRASTRRRRVGPVNGPSERRPVD